ncbi:hypothetical protein AMAG_07806 [Allomyces macrogynus ATCC 38327]|uniref:Uncharacterized protein n=1 Tax=Allomyces macrogynus (strain ATCC 38327) TaxID=578462 RepID=A0A0L0SJC4_ALLM3|nr:hypothetical protein AMAG_07806 [Allomyces macrogynus ATCC 38327]|eukprot:KNE62603.1 hypothetical protein AMAG_07806 [Allomyces macrogynus ATCC 38327]
MDPPPIPALAPPRESDSRSHTLNTLHTILSRVGVLQHAGAWSATSSESGSQAGDDSFSAATADAAGAAPMPPTLDDLLTVAYLGYGLLQEKETVEAQLAEALAREAQWIAQLNDAHSAQSVLERQLSVAHERESSTVDEQEQRIDALATTHRRQADEVRHLKAELDSLVRQHYHTTMQLAEAEDALATLRHAERDLATARLRLAKCDAELALLSDENAALKLELSRHHDALEAERDRLLADLQKELEAEKTMALENEILRCKLREGEAREFELAQQIAELTRSLDKYVDLLQEARDELEYIEERSSTRSDLGVEDASFVSEMSRLGYDPDQFGAVPVVGELLNIPPVGRDVGTQTVESRVNSDSSEDEDDDEDELVMHRAHPAAETDVSDASDYDDERRRSDSSDDLVYAAARRSTGRRSSQRRRARPTTAMLLASTSGDGESVTARVRHEADADNQLSLSFLTSLSARHRCRRCGAPEHVDGPLGDSTAIARWSTPPLIPEEDEDGNPRWTLPPDIVADAAAPGPKLGQLPNPDPTTGFSMGAPALLRALNAFKSSGRPSAVGGPGETPPPPPPAQPTSSLPPITRDLGPYPDESIPANPALLHWKSLASAHVAGGAPRMADLVAAAARHRVAARSLSRAPNRSVSRARTSRPPDAHREARRSLSRSIDATLKVAPNAAWRRTGQPSVVTRASLLGTGWIGAHRSSLAAVAIPEEGAEGAVASAAEVDGVNSAVYHPD